MLRTFGQMRNSHLTVRMNWLWNSPRKVTYSVTREMRGIMLLSVPSKVFCNVLLGRIEEAIDNKFREEQAG